ncbi:hypothetical protein ILUMI_11637, partial [Ignelater luminosus]
KAPEIDNKSPPLEASNSTVVKKVLSKNLGENGAGIRKNYTFTTSPPDMKQTNNDDLVVATVAKNNQTDGDEDEISISKFADEDLEFNKTLQEHNITETKTDTHIYYNSTFITDTSTGDHYWVDMENNRSDVRVNGLLSKSHRRAATVKLSFDFPFYGHLVRNLTIATGGFLYTGEYVHSWLAATQYIAPLMANFDTSLSNDSYIKYVDNGTAFTVQWEKVSLQDKPKDGEFTFQATLLKNGDIIFVYKTIPEIIESIVDDHHPVKVGLSDAYIIERTVFFVRRKTIYEYHRVHFNKEDIKNSTVIYLKSLPTCLDSKDCNTCLTAVISNFQCAWCPSKGLCSNGLDRHRQDWLMKGCDRKQLINESQCSQINNFDNFNHSNGQQFHYGLNTNYHASDLDHSINNAPQISNTLDVNDDAVKQSNSFSDPLQASRISHDIGTMDSNGQVRMGASGIVTILFMIAIVMGLGIWVLYAYRNPHTTSGQILIRYRPSQWRWKRGEARYTAATIHM